jgi:hypothetical protein
MQTTSGNNHPRGQIDQIQDSNSRKG